MPEEFSRLAGAICESAGLRLQLRWPVLRRQDKVLLCGH
jgi:hypothetical protein